MIPLLFLVLFAEGAVALLLMVKIGPLRELAMRGVEQVKTGKGPATVKTLACTLSVILMSSVAAIVRIQDRGHKIGNVSPMDQVLWRTHLLEASLIGYTLFLAFVIDRLHHYLRKLITLRKSANTSREEVEKLQMENRSLREKEEKSASEMKKLQQDMAKLSEDMKKLKSESEDHQRKASDAEAHVNALQKQSEELLLEYDRLLEDNQILQSQLHYKG
ncbi:B-cell receptor-associated protein 31-like [Triticum urartu]|uniref:Endoplasmic reticulum transmembrane protein n=1 Tax=Triticum urartu TaxID=4572 RepID=A0A8R7UCM9_TRIUA|nr:B-cell receptor-associated protein 31-like [Triticum dicoccoides]XP_037422833.1 B-cell receptor-associated protein 31-like [Triticum dicoccoides]XP_048572903.1 B-cell receptor-associated protein 31-like [Triticum urartu]XP_048572904.1 B-cell receptor-associated protein 31-like [Triticum urartu]